MTSWIAMLRTVNPETGVRLTMPRWRQLAMHAGADRPRTYLQGGNLVFDVDGDGLDDVLQTLRAGMEEQFELAVPMVVRSGLDVLQAQRSCPYHAEAAEDGMSVHLGFLSATPDPKKVAALDPARSDRDRFAVVGDVVHVHFEGDRSRSRLTADWFEEQLGVDCVLRSWNAVEQLVKMADPPKDGLGPGLRGLSYVMVMVADMDRSLAFYKDKLGLQATLETPYWSELQAGGVRLALHAGGEGTPPGKSTAGMASLGFNVSDLDATHAVLVERGVSFTQPPTVREQEGIKLAVATDPDGLVLNFAQSLS